MKVSVVIKNLYAAKSGSRTLDVQIAEALGWRKRVETLTNPKTGKPEKRILWVVPSSDDTAKVPAYTTDLQAAYNLAFLIVPSHIGGCSWEAGSASARIGLENENIVAATPAIALCIAALQLHPDNEEEEEGEAS